jgi:predicted GIY-YIG superfamily endonuclease
MSYYVYILQSEKHPDRLDTGFTENLENRLNHHNSGQCPHFSKYKPWCIKTAIAFTDRQKALDFERHSKTPCGRAFAKKRV